MKASNLLYARKEITKYLQGQWEIKDRKMGQINLMKYGQEFSVFYVINKVDEFEYLRKSVRLKISQVPKSALFQC